MMELPCPIDPGSSVSLPRINKDGERAAHTNATRPAKSAPSLKREVGLFSAIAVTIGCTIGSAIFTTPSIVFRYSGSAGVALIIWCLAGCKAMIGEKTNKQIETSRRRHELDSLCLHM